MLLFGPLSHVWFFVTPWTAARQAALSSTTSWSLLKFMSIKSVILSNHLILCHPLPSIFPNIKVFANESPLHVGWPKYWSFSNSHSNEYSVLISFGIDIPRQITWTIKKSSLEREILKKNFKWSLFCSSQLLPWGGMAENCQILQSFKNSQKSGVFITSQQKHLAFSWALT